MNRTVQPDIFLSEIKQLPEIRTAILPNGIKLFLIDIPQSEMVRIDLMFKGGAWVQDKPVQAVLALGNMKEGAAGKTAAQINELLDYHGASFSTTVAKTFSVITVTCLQKHINNVTNILKDIVFEPDYLEEPLNIKIQQMITSYEIQAQKVKTQAEWLFFNELFGKTHPMASFPDLNDFQNTDTKMLRDYYDRFVGSANCNILITGKITDDTVRVIERAFGNDTWGGKFLVDDMEPLMNKFEFCFDNPKHGLYRFEMPQKTVQSNVMSGLVLPKMKGKKKATMILANCLLGGFFGSRLMRNIREEKGLTYGIYSYILSNHLFDVLCISTDTTNEMAGLVIEEIKREIENLANGNLEENELNIVKNYYAGTLCRAYEASLSYPTRIMKLISLDEKPDEVLDMQRFYAEIKPQDIVDFTNDYLAVNDVLWAVAGSKNDGR